jgi:hypothetical protein
MFLFSSSSPVSHEIELSFSLSEVKEEKNFRQREKDKLPAKNTHPHRGTGYKPAIIRRNDQAALAVTDKATYQTNPRNLCELVVSMPPPFSPNTSPERLAIAPRTGQYYPLARILNSSNNLH